MGVKCKQADLLSIYTSFWVEINKDGQGLGKCVFGVCCCHSRRRNNCEFLCWEALLVQKSLSLKSEPCSIKVVVFKWTLFGELLLFAAQQFNPSGAGVFVGR